MCLIARIALILLAGGAGSCVPETGTIGAMLGQRPSGRLFVREAPVGLAAQQQGLIPGDEILLVNGRDVRTMDEREVSRTLSGEVGSPVKLTIVRGDGVFRVTLARTPATRIAY